MRLRPTDYLKAVLTSMVAHQRQTMMRVRLEGGNGSNGNRRSCSGRGEWRSLEDRLSKATRATRFLSQAGAVFTLHEYAYDPEAQQIGLQAASALGVVPQRALKTLMASVDGKPVCVIIPSDQEVSMKRLAAAIGGKSARMMPVGDAERITGYVVGGISPFGQRQRTPVVIEQQATRHDRVFVNGGQRGLQINLSPDTIIRKLGAISAAVAQ